MSPSLALMTFLTATLVQSTAAMGPATVLGHVVEQSSGLPIAGASVTLRFVRPEPERLPFQHQSFSGKTNQQGRFEFAGLEAGRYHLSVDRDGFALTEESLHAFDVSPGERHQVESLTLEREAVIVGRVLAEDGSPLAGATVRALREWTDHSSNGATRLTALLALEARTSESGDFRLTRLPAGDFYIQATPPRDVERVGASNGWISLSTFFPQAVDPADGQRISIATGGRSEPITIRIVGAPTYEVSGIVLDSSGQSIVNARLELVEDEPGAQPTVNGISPRTSRTDASGQFTITNVVDGTYALLVVAPEVISIEPYPDGPANSGWGGASVMVACGTGDRKRRSVVHTETRNGITTRYSFIDAIEVPLTVRGTSANGLRVIVSAKP